MVSKKKRLAIDNSSLNEIKPITETQKDFCCLIQCIKRCTRP